MKQKTQNIIFLITEKLGVPKSIVWGLVISFIVGIISVSFAFVKTTTETNKDLPIEKQKAIEAEKVAIAQSVAIEVIKTNAVNTDKNVVELKTDMKEGFERIERRLSEMTGQNKRIIKQTE